MSKNVYLVREDYYPEGTENGNPPLTDIIGVYGNLASAEKAISCEMEELHNDITEDDENNESRVSFELPWDGYSASIGSDSCAVWKLTIKCRTILDEQ